jgi:hypothetical protein
VAVDRGVAVGDVATVDCGVAVADAVAVSSGVGLSDPAVSSGVALGNSRGRGVETIAAPIVAGNVSRVRLCVRNCATPEVIATATETIPNAIAQRARR